MASNQVGQVTAHFGDTNFGALPFTYTVPEGFLPGVYNSSAGSWNLVGTLENTGSTTFSGLTDTPDTYDDGHYLRVTASGITTVSGIILEAPNGSEWLLQVTNSGTLYTTEVV